MKTSVAVGACVLSLAIAAFAWAQMPPVARPGDKNPGHLKMALVNMRCLFSASPNAENNKANIQKNLERHFYFIDKATAQGAEFVGFPELSVNGYQFNPNTTWLSLGGPEVQMLAQKAVEKGIYLSAGIAEQDADGKKWNTQFVIAPDGKIVGWHHKVWLTEERGFTEKGTDHNVFDVKGFKMGISTCADGTDYFNLKALVDNGAQIIYGPHANTTGSTIAGWYRFRARWGGKWDGNFTKAKTSNEGPEADMPSGGWVDQLNVYAALHNHAALSNPDFDPPAGVTGALKGWASGAWFIGPDGSTLAQMPTSTNKADSKEYLLICNVPVGQAPVPATAGATTAPAPASATAAVPAPAPAAANTAPAAQPVADPVAAARAKKVSVTFNKTPLRDVCVALTRDTGITVSSQLAFLDKPVTIDAKDETLDKVLEAIARQVGATVQVRNGQLRFRAGAAGR